MPIHRDRLNMTDRFLETVRRVKLKSRMLEICKSGSVRGIEVFSYGLNIVTLRKPKGRRNREYKINLNAGDHIMSTRHYGNGQNGLGEVQDPYVAYIVPSVL